jgi:hypothetical protein
MAALMNGDSSTDNQFIFREIEFEDENFHAALFVAKYRRVTTLDSLRDQLRLYCDALKQQLYSIINRDYKDFITIATKLDGVDVRAEHLRKPLVDLRLDLSALHDGMVSSMQTIEEKLKNREDVVTKRRILEATLACMEKLDTAEQIVLNVQQQDNRAPSSGEGVSSKHLSRRGLLKSFSKAQGVAKYSSLSRDIFDCSELERAAHSVAQAERYLASLSHSISAGRGTSSVTQKSLEQRLDRLIEQLVQRVRARLVAIFSSAVSDSASARGNDSPENSDSFPSRAFAHCLRALVALSRGEVAEEVVAETVTRPLAKQLLTQGKVDGSGGRGSYVGLQPALESIASQVMTALAMPLQACSETFPIFENQPIDNSSSSSNIPPVLRPMDLIIRGVWAPIASMLTEKFSGMFSVGIASTLARCYRAVETFIAVLQTQSDLITNSYIKIDLASHSSIAPFHDNWKLDIYLQVCHCVYIYLYIYMYMYIYV